MTSRVLEVCETPYGTISVCEEGEVRLLYVEEAMEGAMYTDEMHREELVFPYLQQLRYPMSLLPKEKDVYMIGSAGFSYPYSFLKTESGNITCAEISKQMAEIARNYFFLKEIEENPRFHLVLQDGFAWLDNTEKQFDCIINDAYVSDTPVGLERRNTEKMHAHLTTGGIYVINFSAALCGKEADPYYSFMEQLESVFTFTTTLVVEEDRDVDEKQNLLVLASDADYGW